MARDYSINFKSVPPVTRPFTILLNVILALMAVTFILALCVASTSDTIVKNDKNEYVVAGKKIYYHYDSPVVKPQRYLIVVKAPYDLNDSKGIGDYKYISFNGMDKYKLGDKIKFDGTKEVVFLKRYEGDNMTSSLFITAFFCFSVLLLMFILALLENKD